jgi:histone H3/H4
VVWAQGIITRVITRLSQLKYMLIILIGPLWHIREEQKKTDLVIARSRFRMLVCEIIQSLGKEFRLQAAAVEALQEGAESYLVSVLDSKIPNAISW